MSQIGQLDIASLRADTPGTAHRIHLNNAGASLMPAPVIAAMKKAAAVVTPPVTTPGPTSTAIRIKAVSSSHPCRLKA